MPLLWNPDLYNRALWFAGRAHLGQKVPGSEISYLLHLSQVCQESLGALVADPSLDGDLVMTCALLHDTVEDTPLTREDVADAFGEPVAAGVAALSKRSTINGRQPSKDEAMDDSLVRIREQPREIWVVKLADRITNLQEPPAHWRPEKICAYHAQAIRIRDALGEASAALTVRIDEKLAVYLSYTVGR